MRIISLFFALILSLGLKAQFFSYSSGSAIDSGEVIGSFMYLFQANDTIIIDLSTLSVDDDSLWSISSGNYRPIYEYPLEYDFGDYVLTNTDDLNGTGIKFSGTSVNDANYSLLFNGVFDEGDGTTMGLIAVDTFDNPNAILLYPEFGLANLITENKISIYSDTLNGGIREYSLFVTDETSDYPARMTMNSNQIGFSIGDTTARYEYGFTGYGRDYDGSADHFVFDILTGLDISGIFARKNRASMQYLYSVESINNYSENNLIIDSANIRFVFDSPSGTNSGLNLTAKLDSSGFVIPSSTTDLQGSEGAFWYDTDNSRILAYQEGSWQEVIHNTGWARYDNTTYTSGSPLVINQGDTTTLHFDSCIICDYLPFEKDSLYSVGDSTLITDAVGNTYIVTLDFKASNSTNGGYGSILIDIGGSVGIILDRLYTFPKGSGNSHSFSTTNFFYTLDTFLANGGKISWYSESGNTSLWNLQLRIQKL